MQRPRRPMAWEANSTSSCSAPTRWRRSRGRTPAISAAETRASKNSWSADLQPLGDLRGFALEGPDTEDAGGDVDRGRREHGYPDAGDVKGAWGAGVDDRHPGLLEDQGQRMGDEKIAKDA